MYKITHPLSDEEHAFYTAVFAELDKLIDSPYMDLQRLNKCKAWHHEIHFRDRSFPFDFNVVLLKSYDTVVALYDLETGSLISRGRFSQTTYQHIAKFRKLLIEQGKRIQRDANLNLVSWFNN